MLRKHLHRLLIILLTGLLCACTESDGAKTEHGDTGQTADEGTSPDDPGVDPGESEDPGEPPADEAPAGDTAPDEGKEPVPETCAGHDYDFKNLLPGPCQTGYDADLARKARLVDRQWTTFNAAAHGLSSDVGVAEEDRALVEGWLSEKDDWDFEAYAGKPATEVISSHHKVAGLYGGVGAAADAYRYGVLRDQGYPKAEVDQARKQLLRAMDAIHLATRITGVPGVIARGFGRIDLPGDGQNVTTVPLKDGDGNPLPEPKNNGTWREDFSGEYPNYRWEDSCSRDMYVGWVSAYAAVWEVIAEDPAFSDELKQRLRKDATDIARELMVVRDGVHDLEIPDADGRTTYHGYLHENTIDRVYVPGPLNGFTAMMSVGIVAAWVYVTGDADLEAWFEDELLAKRRIHEVARDKVGLVVDLGEVSNYSNYNMAFQGGWLAISYLRNEEARAAVREGLGPGLYDRPGRGRQPREIGHSLFDFTWAAAKGDYSAHRPMTEEPDLDALESGLWTLRHWREPPTWGEGILNCPDAVCDCDDPEVSSSECTAEDGRPLTVLGCVGRNCDLICVEPLPITIRPTSNYYWRSNPYRPNGGGGGLLPSVDFRIAYWMARWARR